MDHQENTSRSSSNCHQLVELVQASTSSNRMSQSTSINTPPPPCSPSADEADSSDFVIARRTRSHVHVDDFVNNDNLDFPDVDKNLYNPDSPEESDPLYKDFLNQIYSRPVEQTTDTNTDDNDPAYVYNDDIFSHGWAFDLEEGLVERRQLAYVDQASSSNIVVETRDPMIEIIEEEPRQLPVKNQAEQEDEDKNLSDETGVARVINICDTLSPNKLARARRIDVFSQPEFARVMNQQLRQHIQLLTQTYLLTKHTTNMQDRADEAEGHLNAYMKVFKNRTKPSNLLPAMELVKNCGTPKNAKSSVRLSWRQLPIPESVKKIINEKPTLFMYESLLPEVAYSTSMPTNLGSRKPKIFFTLNEDKLLAYALNEFKGESSQYAYIASLLMAAKTKMQINNHIKNLKRGPGNEDNPVKLYLLQGKLPQIDLDSDKNIRQLKSQQEEKEFSSVGESEEKVDKEEEEDKEKIKGEEEIPNHQNQEAHEISTNNISSELELDPKTPDNRTSSFDNSEATDNKEDNMEEQCYVNNEQQGGDDGVGNLQPQLFDCHDPLPYHNHDDMMNMNLEDLMTASTTITKTSNLMSVGGFGGNNNNQNGNNPYNNNLNGNNISEKNIKNMKLRKSMLSLMSQKFLLSSEMGELIIQEFIKASHDNLNERNYLHLLQLLTELMRKESKRINSDESNSIILIYNEIVKFLTKIEAPKEIRERLVLFLNLDQAAKCGCAVNYLHWMRFFEFMRHVELYHEGEAVEKKLLRLIDALQKDDPHKVKLATANLVNKHPLLQRELDSLAMDGRPHPSLFINEEDFDDITEPITIFDSKQHQPTDDNNNNGSIQLIATSSSNNHDVARPLDLFDHEHFEAKLTAEEMNYASQACPCKCHHQSGQPHCNKCNLKFMKGRMYLVNKIKPFLAEWAYSTTSAPIAAGAQVQQLPAPAPFPPPPPPPAQSITESLPPPTTTTDIYPKKYTLTPRQYPRQVTHEPSQSAQQQPQQHQLEWTFEEDKEILEFCRQKAELNDENVSFDTTTFEELVTKRRLSSGSPSVLGSSYSRKKSARDIAERFNHLMEMYRREGTTS